MGLPIWRLDIILNEYGSNGNKRVKDCCIGRQGKMCRQLYRIVVTSIDSIVGYDHITILMLKAEETYLSATHYSDGLKGSCVYQVHRSKEYLSAYWS